MTLRLSVRRTAWDADVRTVTESVDGLVPVVKGNGYGFGRAWLAERAGTIAPRIAVGTVWELADVPAGRTGIVLTPALDLPGELRGDPILTVGSPAHVGALRTGGFVGRVTVKLRSSMDRYGVDADGLESLVAVVADARLEIDGFALHLPLAGSDDERVVEVERWLGRLPRGAPLSVSHLAPDVFAALQRRNGHRPLSLRLGTALWHGDKTALQLHADVVDRRTVGAGTRIGYRLAPVTADEVLLVGAGTAHGVTPLPDGRSPFHFAGRRLALHEPPHMHTSMVVANDDGPLPDVGDWVDVQRPLTAIAADVVHWS